MALWVRERPSPKARVRNSHFRPPESRYALALGMQRWFGPEPAPRAPCSSRGGFRVGLAAVMLLLFGQARCTFPEYDVAPPMGNGGGGAAGATSGAGGSAETTAGSDATGGTGIGGTSEVPSGGDGPVGGEPPLGGAGGAAGAEPIGGAPECAPEQWPVEHCQAHCLRRRPDHCYDGKQSGDEIDRDCGGSCQACTNETCGRGTDCLSGECTMDGAALGRCYAPLQIVYTASDPSWKVSSLAWKIFLNNEEPSDGEAFRLRDIKVRYYFERAEVVEPLLLMTKQSYLHRQGGITYELQKTSFTIERTEAKPDVLYDGYVEVAFDESGQLAPGENIELFQQLVTGDTAASNFDQRANYSFTEEPNAAFLHITVFYEGRLIWGLEPRPANPRQCFARGVNLNGPAVKISGNDWQSSTDARPTITGSSSVTQNVALYPAASGDLASMLQSSFHLGVGSEVDLPTENGQYLLYAYAVSPGSDTPAASLTVQGMPPRGAKFRSQAVQGGQTWARLGPFRADVVDGTLRVGVTAGALNLAGLELWYPD